MFVLLSSAFQAVLQYGMPCLSQWENLALHASFHNFILALKGFTECMSAAIGREIPEPDMVDILIH